MLQKGPDSSRNRHAENLRMDKYYIDIVANYRQEEELT